jgi:hypothetical protein
MKKMHPHVHGVILLSTVAAESVLIFFNALWNSVLPHAFTETLLFVGAFFYMTGLSLIIARYFSKIRGLDWANQWTNTNCIMHGAMSITGLAGVLSHTISSKAAVGIWVWVLVWFAVVEGCEITRAVYRIKKLGLSGAIGKYDVSQWARNFTFGMFFAFTMNLTVPAGSFLSGLQKFVLTYGAWVVLILFVNELFLLLAKNRTQHAVKSTYTMYQ